MHKRFIKHGLVAGAHAAVWAGAPSTACALATGADPLEATAAAGAMLLRNERRRQRLLLAAIPVHLALSFGWGVVLAATLPRRATVAWGVTAGLAIAGLDLGLVGRRFERIRALPLAPQLADHVAYGAIAAALIARERATVRQRPSRGADLLT